MWTASPRAILLRSLGEASLIPDIVEQWLSGPPRSTVSVSFTAAGKTVVRSIERETPPGELAQFGNLPPERIRIERRKLEDGVGYIRLNLFLDPVLVMPEIEKAIEEFRSAPGSIGFARQSGRDSGHCDGHFGLVCGEGWLASGRHDEPRLDGEFHGHMLFDGNPLWLVDWEAAFQNDRYADLAVVANMIVTNEAEERIYLQEYFGELPDEYQRARFYLMRQLGHMFYAMAFLTLGSSGEPVAAYSDFQRRFWARETSLADNHAKTVYGRVHWEQLSQNMRQARFDEALRIR